MALNVGQLVDIGSGALYAAIGCVLLAARPAKHLRMLVGVHLLVLGTGFIIGNIVVDDRNLAVANALLFLPGALALWLAAPAMPLGDRVRREWLALAFGLSIAGAIVRAWTPLIISNCVGQGQGTAQCASETVAYFLPAGPDSLFLYTDAAYFAATLFALIVLALQYRSIAGDPRASARAALLSMALLAYPAFRAGIDMKASQLRVLGTALGDSVGIILLALVGFVWLAHAHRLGGTAGRRARDVALVAFLAPAAGIAVTWLAGSWLAAYQSGAVGASRLVVVGVFVFAAWRHELFDLDRATLRTLSRARLAGTAAAVVATVLLSSLNAVFAIVLGAIAAAALYPIQLLREDPAEALDTRRRLDIYRAALERASPQDEAGREILAALRARLAISEREHALLVAESGSTRAVRYSPGERVLGKYRLDEMLGEGGYGRTFLAFDETLHRRVVLKVAHVPTRGEGQRLMREARILAKLRHPNVIAVHDVEQVGDDVVIVLEHAERGSLMDRLVKGALPRDDALRLARDVLAALGAAHAAGVVHRDVKPSNILLAADGRAMVADFGIASGRESSGTMTGISLTASPGAGTVQYMSPEQARGLPADAASDLYSAAAVLYECLAGRPYLDLRGKPEFEARRAVVEDAPYFPVQGIDPPIEGVLRSALAKDPALRPASAGAFLGLLDGQPGGRR